MKGERLRMRVVCQVACVRLRAELDGAGDVAKSSTSRGCRSTRRGQRRQGATQREHVWLCACACAELDCAPAMLASSRKQPSRRHQARPSRPCARASLACARTPVACTSPCVASACTVRIPAASALLCRSLLHVSAATLHPPPGKGRTALLLLKNGILPSLLMRRTKVQCADDLALPPR